MAVDVIRLVQGDERPFIILSLTDDITGTAIDLSNPNTSVLVRFREAGTTQEPAVINCQILSPATGGKAVFNFVGGVLDVEPGMYEGEVVINFDGEIETVYETLRFRVRENFGELPEPEPEE
jgi:hypothetical protein